MPRHVLSPLVVIRIMPVTVRSQRLRDGTRQKDEGSRVPWDLKFAGPQTSGTCAKDSLGKLLTSPVSRATRVRECYRSIKIAWRSVPLTLRDRALALISGFSHFALF